MAVPADDAVLRIQGVRKSFGHTVVLDGIDLEVAKGEVVCLIGRSGSGKTTLLRCIDHLETINAGGIWVSGEMVGYEKKGSKYIECRERDIARKRREIGVVFQHFNLFPHKTAIGNVIEGPTQVLGVPRRKAEESGLELLARVGLADKAGSYPQYLSGGQQQRVAIARALAMNPKLMLFDEPTSALDPEVSGEVLEVIRQLAGDGMTMIIATHELRFAAEVADTVIYMEHGRIAVSGSPDTVLRNPSDPRLRTFLRMEGFAGDDMRPSPLAAKDI